MTLGPTDYVPILKVKRGEKGALRAMAETSRRRITPLLEIVERTDKALDEHLVNALSGLSESLNGYPRCFLDAREIERDGPTGADGTFRRAADAGITFTPVTGITRGADVAAALRFNANGLALRLTRRELEDGILLQGIPGFMAAHGLTHEYVDLIVDLGALDDFVTEGVVALGAAFLGEIPNQSKWRSLIISGCAFPRSMGVVQRNSYAYIERMEWNAWRDNLRANANQIERLPTYSDSVIQHPEGVEGFDPTYMQASATIRYTLTENWLLIKGESTRRFPAREQFPQLATQLVYGIHRHHFMGRDHCPGCRSMAMAADGEPRLGSPEVWRRLGTIHHISTVIQQL